MSDDKTAAAASASGHASDDLTVFKGSLADFVLTGKDLERKLSSALTRLEADFSNVDDCVTAHASQTEQYTRLTRMFQQLKESEKSEGAKREIDECAVALTRAKLSLDRLKDAKSKTGSLYLRLMMGKVNVKMWKRSEQLTFKEEYEKFKRRTTYIFTLFPLIQLFWANRLVFTIHQGWLLYYYTSLALRENILQVNGSTIMNWWIVHHYISMTIAALMLSLQLDHTGGISAAQLFNKMHFFFLFCVLQGVVMLVQSWYQSNRSYVRKSIGKAKQIDVHSTETLVEKPTDLKVLVPLLFTLYAAELGLGADLAYFWAVHATESYALLGVAILMVVLGVGNAYTTISVLRQKQQLRNFERSESVRSRVPLTAAAGDNKSKAN